MSTKDADNLEARVKQLEKALERVTKFQKISVQVLDAHLKRIKELEEFQDIYNSTRGCDVSGCRQSAHSGYSKCLQHQCEHIRHENWNVKHGDLDDDD